MLDHNIFIQHSPTINVFNKGIKNDVMEIELMSGKKIVCSLVQKFLTKGGPLHLYKIINEKAEILTVDGYEKLKNNVCLPPCRMVDVEVAIPTIINNIAIC